MPMNNVNVERVKQEMQAITADPAKGRRVNRLEGQWSLVPGSIQLAATAKFEKGEVMLVCDSPSFMGGQGQVPGPLQYCAMGFLACFTSTYATAAAQRGVALQRLNVAIECDLDFGRVFGLNQDPAIHQVRFSIDVAGADRATLEAIKEEALAHCPAVFALRNPIDVKATVA